MTRRTSPLAALALLLPIALAAACDDRPLPDKGIADGEEDEGIDEEMADEDEDEPPPPASHRGEACEGKLGDAQVCSVDGVVGTERCVFDPFAYAETWSVCFTDACERAGATQACTSDGEAGTQHCLAVGLGHFWGECVVEPECTPGERRACFGDDAFGIDQSCHLSPEGVPYWNWEDCNTPLVLSFDGRAPAFAAAPASAAAFDVTGAGACLSTDWPTAATPWLALDRDHSGSIDGGSELFGNGTRTALGGRAEHGFAALAELDSDGDGRISAADAAFAELVLWADHDGDRRSSGWELLPLAAYGVESIDLEYRRATACDERGNCGVERAAFTFRDGGRSQVGEVVDVYLACAE